MFKGQSNRVFLALALIAIFALMAPAISLASGPTGTGYNDALAPTGATEHLALGAQRWYAFSTGGLQADNTASQVTIFLQASPAGSAIFKVWSQQELNDIPNQDADKPVKAMGEGTLSTYVDGSQKLDRYSGDLAWHSGFKSGGTFYVQVLQAGSTATSYNLMISGDSLSFPTEIRLASAPAMPRLLPVTGAAPATAAAVAGSSAESAAATTGALVTIKPGQQQWFKVVVPGNSDSDAHPNIIADLAAASGGAFSFSVWTPERLSSMASEDAPGDVKAVGQGTVSSFKDNGETVARYNGDLRWQGDARIGGIYYFVVSSNGANAGQYRLNVNVTN